MGRGIESRQGNVFKNIYSCLYGAPLNMYTRDQDSILPTTIFTILNMCKLSYKFVKNKSYQSL
jgi:hypothetical protein